MQVSAISAKTTLRPYSTTHKPTGGRKEPASAVVVQQQPFPVFLSCIILLVSRIAWTRVHLQFMLIILTLVQILFRDRRCLRMNVGRTVASGIRLLILAIIVVVGYVRMNFNNVPTVIGPLLTVCVTTIIPRFSWMFWAMASI